MEKLTFPFQNGNFLSKYFLSPIFHSEMEIWSVYFNLVTILVKMVQL